MALSRLALLFATPIAIQVIYTPPQPVSSSDEVHSRLLNSPAWRLGLYRSIIWALTITEALVHFLVAYDKFTVATTVKSFICPSGPSVAFGSVNIAFIIGTLLFILGGSLRFACYRTLGRLYTFEHTTRPKHNLITHGPYAYVRHPGYTAIAPTSVAAVLTFLSAGGWIRECGIWEGGGIWTAIRWAFGAWVVGATYINYELIRRADREDRTLQKKFGKEWEDYRKRVPWKFLPYVI